MSAVFVDYDNIYLSLKRKSEEAAKRFAKDAGVWLREIESGRLITATNAPSDNVKRRIVMNRCYGNPVPRRNQNDNSTDMNSFPFVRHHFLRSGFEIVDCPPLTAQLKNSSDIRMVMDVRDYLTHETHFDEFIILSGDADFTPVLHRLRAHARRTVIFANDFTAAPYTAISDGEVREADLINLIMTGQIGDQRDAAPIALSSSSAVEDVRRDILNEVAAVVRAAPAPVPLEALAERAQRALGHDKTVATGWAGAGSFRELLAKGLPEDVRITAEPPFLAFDARRHGDPRAGTQQRERDPMLDLTSPPPLPNQGAGMLAMPPQVPMTPAAAPAMTKPEAAPAMPPAAALPPAMGAPMAAPPMAPPMGAPMAPPPGAAAPQRTNLPVPGQPQAAAPAAAQGPQSAVSTAIQRSIARIQDACQAPPLAPFEYRTLFEAMAAEISDNDLIGAQTLANVVKRAHERGIEVRKDDVRFILEVVSEADPWFEQGASANLFAGRFRNFVVARCRSQGLNLSADELDLIDAWFAGTSTQPVSQQRGPEPAGMMGPGAGPADDMPRIMRTRM